MHTFFTFLAFGSVERYFYSWKTIDFIIISDEVSDSEVDEVIDDGDSQMDEEEEEEEESGGEENVVVDDESQTYVSVDGTEWQKNPARQSGLKKVYTPHGQHFDTHEQFFSSIFDQKIIDVIVQYTNIEGEKRSTNFKTTDAIEMKAFIGILFATGVRRSSKRNFREFFHSL